MKILPIVGVLLLFLLESMTLTLAGSSSIAPGVYQSYTPPPILFYDYPNFYKVTNAYFSIDFYKGSDGSDIFYYANNSIAIPSEKTYLNVQQNDSSWSKIGTPIQTGFYKNNNNITLWRKFVNGAGLEYNVTYNILNTESYAEITINMIDTTNSNRTYQVSIDISGLDTSNPIQTLDNNTNTPMTIKYGDVKIDYSDVVQSEGNIASIENSSDSGIVNLSDNIGIEKTTNDLSLQANPSPIVDNVSLKFDIPTTNKFTLDPSIIIGGVSAGPLLYPTEYTNYRKVLRDSNGTLYAIFSTNVGTKTFPTFNISIYTSTDFGETWNLKNTIGNDALIAALGFPGAAVTSNPVVWINGSNYIGILNTKGFNNVDVIISNDGFNTYNVYDQPFIKYNINIPGGDVYEKPISVNVAASGLYKGQVGACMPSNAVINESPDFYPNGYFNTQYVNSFQYLKFNGTQFVLIGNISGYGRGGVTGGSFCDLEVAPNGTLFVAELAHPNHDGGNDNLYVDVFTDSGTQGLHWVNVTEPIGSPLGQTNFLWDSLDFELSGNNDYLVAATVPASNTYGYTFVISYVANGIIQSDAVPESQFDLGYFSYSLDSGFTSIYCSRFPTITTLSLRDYELLCTSPTFVYGLDSRISSIELPPPSFTNDSGNPISNLNGLILKSDADNYYAPSIGNSRFPSFNNASTMIRYIYYDASTNQVLFDTIKTGKVKPILGTPTTNKSIVYKTDNITFDVLYKSETRLNSTLTATWCKNGSQCLFNINPPNNVVMRINYANRSGTNVSFTLGGGNFSKGDMISMSVYANDTDGMNSTVVYSNNVTIQDSLPIITSITITPSPAQINDTLTCSYNYTDADGDIPAGAVVDWYTNDILTQGGNVISNLHLGAKVKCEVMLTLAPMNISAAANSSIMTIGDFTPPSIITPNTNSNSILNNQNFIISDICTDNASSISSNYVTVQKPDNTSANYTLTLFLGSYSYTYTDVIVLGTYQIGPFYCLDSSGNLATSNTMINVTSSLPPISPPSITGSGSGESGQQSQQKINCNISLSNTNFTFVGADTVLPLTISNNQNISFTPIYSRSSNFEIRALATIIPAGQSVQVATLRDYTGSNTLSENITISSSLCNDIPLTITYIPSNSASLGGIDYIKQGEDYVYGKVSAKFSFFGLDVPFYVLLILALIPIIVLMSYAENTPIPTRFLSGSVLYLVIAILILIAIPISQVAPSNHGYVSADIVSATASATNLLSIGIATSSIGGKVITIPAWAIFLSLSLILIGISFIIESYNIIIKIVLSEAIAFGITVLCYLVIFK